MSTEARKRLIKDFRGIQNEPPTGVDASPDPNNIMKWRAVIFGPDGTIWEDGVFKLSLEFTEKYPQAAPDVRFVSRIFHPNVYADGSICLDILQKAWSPIYTASAVLTSIQSLLSDPNPNSPANSEASKLYLEDRAAYIRRVQEVVIDSLAPGG